MTSRNPAIHVRLIPVSEAARRLVDVSAVEIQRFPFKVGRESRTEPSGGVRSAIERRLGREPKLNDLNLPQPWTDGTLDVSREHFQIETEGERFYLTDRGSACGTIVAGRRVGGARAGGRVELHDRDRIFVGTASSAYVFEFRTG